MQRTVNKLSSHEKTTVAFGYNKKKITRISWYGQKKRNVVLEIGS
jgi:uncharacterized protein YdaL